MAALLWDVQEEHLGEAEFFWETWERAVDSPIFTIGELRTGPEERLMANIMGLVVGGQVVLDRLVRPILDEDLDDDRYRTAAAALAILDGGGFEGPDVVLAYLPRAGVLGQWGLVRAMHLSRRTDLAPRLIASLPDHDGLALAGRLEALTGLGVDVGKRLRVWFKHELPRVRQAAAWLARYSSSSSVLKRLLKLMHDPDPKLREAAIESALIRGLPGSWQLACEAAFDPRSPTGAGSLRRTALGWVAMQGDAASHARILDLLRARPDADLLWAAGVTGRPDAVDLAVQLLDHPLLARLAGELMTFVAGLPTRVDDFWLDEGAHGIYGDDEDEALPVLGRDDLTANLVPPDELRLRLPNPERARAWWLEQRNELSPALRYYAGRPLEPSTIEHALHTAPMRRRHPLALELAIRSAGIGMLDTRAPARIQLAQTRAIFASLDQLRAQGRGSVDFQGGLPVM
ncbi:hypothetical protein DB30_06716 [Enhygromyxa salina]|uniref:HEAT repeat protein n=1 Tax=Enhygromyxa salina TaxID=215803 RepID=A0A0C1ZA50_9BACT|nr:HEAT repeat domain-containing protein [Enhygromyxa salina]KIG14489.1 hypothetical protein DB30_06716 [Enhygromyxa salina]